MDMSVRVPELSKQPENKKRLNRGEHVRINHQVHTLQLTKDCKKSNIRDLLARAILEKLAHLIRPRKKLEGIAYLEEFGERLPIN